MKLLFDLARKSRNHNSLLHDPHYVALAICGEAGELANLVKKTWAGYQEVSIDQVNEEIADVLNYLVYLCLLNGMTVEQLESLAMEKILRYLAKRGVQQL